MHKRKKISHYSIALFFVLTTVVQLLSSFPVFAAGATPPTQSGGSYYTQQTYIDRLKILKYYQAIDYCMQQTGSSGMGTMSLPLSDGNLVAPKWFGDSGSTQESIGVVADTDDHNGLQSCDDIVKTTMGNGGLFGFSSYSDAGTTLGLQKNGNTPGSVYAALGKYLFNDTSPNLTSLYNFDAMSYYDLFNTATVGVCQAHIADSNDPELKSNPDLAKNPSAYNIYVVSDTGKVSQAYYIFPKANDHNVSFGWSPDSVDQGKKLGCDAIAKKLEQKSRADRFAKYIANNPNDLPSAITPDSTDGSGATPSTCNIDGIGWIICPVLNFMANIVDQSYNVVDAMLTVSAFNSGGTNDTQLQDAWSNMRNIANVAFVLVFMFIIYSQITGFGVSNYGIKKMLPRLIIAAILVNVSYWLCALAVDISNVFGDSMKNLFSGLGGTFGPPNSLNWAKNGTGWTGIVGGIVAGSVATGALLFVGLAALVPALVAVIIAIVTVLLVLVIRQALIILLIVISPLAFVAFLLPNTQQWFKKWRELFQILLLMYPIIGAIFGASQLASSIVMNSATGYSDKGLQMAIQVMGAAVAIVPLFITPIVMKTAGGVLNNIAGKINNPNKGPFDRMRKGAEGFRESKKSDMRARRMNYDEGGNRVSRAWRRTAGLSTRTGVRMKAGGERAKAAEAAAEAGLLMENKSAIQAGKLNMAKSAADSARQAESLKDYSSEDQMAALGQRGSTNQSLIYALNSQEKQAEHQAIKEQEQFHAKDSVAQLGTAMRKAIVDGNAIAAQAIQNQLETKGNGGTIEMERVVQAMDSTMSAGMRTELSRNMGGGTMSRSEALKNWAISTELSEDGTLHNERPVLNDDGTQKLDNQGQPVMKRINVDYQSAKQDLLKSTDIKVEKLAAQNGSLQHEMILHAIDPTKPGGITIDTMKSALSSTNRAHFDPKDIALMEKAVADATAAAASTSNPAGGTPPAGSQMSGQGTLPGL